MKDDNKFVECAEVYGNWYGVPRSQVTDGLEAVKDVILKIDVQGAATVRQMAPNALFIFMLPGSLKELHDRLSQRMTESASQIALRLKTASDEMKQSSLFNVEVINGEDRLDRAVANIDSAITSEKQRTGRTPMQLL